MIPSKKQKKKSIDEIAECYKCFPEDVKAVINEIAPL